MLFEDRNGHISLSVEIAPRCPEREVPRLHCLDGRFTFKVDLVAIITGALLCSETGHIHFSVHYLD